MSKKDIVYIDAEDDITAVIDRVVSSSSKIVALVLPKRFSTLQSIVNMKLLKRSADDAKKQAVLITNEASLLPLAGTVGIYVSDSLKTRPSVPEAGIKLEIDETVIEDDAPEIDLNTPIGDLTKSANTGKKPDLSQDDEPSTGFVGGLVGGIATKAKGALSHLPVIGSRFSDSAKAKVAKSDIAVPNFNKFRNRIVFGVVGLVVFIVGWVFAFVILPNATVNIQAQTTKLSTELDVVVDAKLEADNLDELQVRAEVREIKRTVSEAFPATGEKDVGERATGIISLENCYKSSPVDVPSGTVVVDNTAGIEYTTTSSVTVGEAEFNNGCTRPGRADVPVIANDSGDDKNLSPRSYTLSGFDGMIAFGSQMSGGTSQIVKVISPADIEEATKKLLEKTDESVEAELSGQFGESFFVIEESFNTTIGDTSSEPEVNAQVDEGRVTAQFTYTLMAVPKTSVEALLAAEQTEQIDSAQEVILDNGYGSLEAKVVKQNSINNLEIELATDGFAGPEIDTAQLAEEISGKRFSEAVDIIEAKPGVREVDVSFAPFWVFSAPSASKITINVEVVTQTTNE